MLPNTRAEVSVVTFGERVETLVDFGPIETQSVPILTAGGSTPMGEAVNRALDLLEARKTEYKGAGVDYFQPWMVLMTDGEPTDDIGSAAHRSTSLINDKKLTIFPIAIGSGANLNTLKAFSPKRAPLPLKGLNFREFFEWLSKSVERVSQSTPGEKVPLDTEAMKGWANV